MTATENTTMTSSGNNTTTSSEDNGMITFENVTKVYSDQTVAIENVSFEVEKGTTTVLVGPSGCGKTTTMKLVNRLEDPTDGTVYYDGIDVQELDEIKLRRDIGYVIQEIGLFDHMTVGENVATVPELRGWDEERIDERVDELLDLMNLSPEEHRDQYPTALSGGQQQRVGVARALAADPDVMLMDEPFGALDPITRQELQDEFLDIQSQINTTILFVTHDIDEALKMGEKIALFDIGEIVQHATPHEILENPANDFVEDFIGEDRALKQLQVTRVEEVMEAADAEHEQFAAAGSADPDSAITDEVGADDELAMSPNDNAQTALSRMIQANRDAIPVVEDGRAIGVVTQTDIRQQYNTAEGSE